MSNTGLGLLHETIIRIKKFWLLFKYKLSEEARETIYENIKTFPDNASFYELKAIFGADAKDRLESYDKIIELEGSLEVGQFYNRHNDLYALGRYEEALSDYYYMVCGIAEGLFLQYFNRNAKCNVVNYNISKNKEDSFVDISVEII